MKPSSPEEIREAQITQYAQELAGLLSQRPMTAIGFMSMSDPIAESVARRTRRILKIRALGEQQLEQKAS